MKINKHFLQLFAALWILLYHVWIPLTGSVAEVFLIRVGYVGVDIFFFCSAYSLGNKQLTYGPFVRNRFANIYSKFLIFVLVAAIYKGWTLSRTFQVAAGVEFFQKGGGSFLWFLPGILLFYLIYPGFLNWRCRYKSLVVIILWLLASIFCQQFFGYSKIFILTNRIPSMLLGYQMKQWLALVGKDEVAESDISVGKNQRRVMERWVSMMNSPVYGLMLSLLGIYILYQWGFIRRLNVPIKEIYFVLGLPLLLGLAMISTKVKNSRLLTLLSSATLELYALQMIFGTKLATTMYKACGNKFVTNLVTIITLMAFSVVLAWGFQKITSNIKYFQR